MTTRRLAIIGDVGGQAQSLRDELQRLGVDPNTGRIPEDLEVVQLGDLVHRGPDTASVIATVERCRINGGGRWHQLLGNHESQHVRSPIFTWTETLDPATLRTLQRWWDRGWMKLAHATSTEGLQMRRKGGDREQVGVGDLLITHAGLTYGLWNHLGKPMGAHAAARAINDRGRQLGPDEHYSVFGPGMMLLPGGPQLNAGVLWAQHGWELVGSWRGREFPGFHQAHGHSCDFDFDRGRWRAPMVNWLADGSVQAKVQPLSRLITVEIPARPDWHGQDEPDDNLTQVLWSTDPGHYERAAATWSALELSRSS